MFDIGERVVCTGGGSYDGVEGEVTVSSAGLLFANSYTVVRVDPTTIRNKRIRSSWNERNKDWSFYHHSYTLKRVDKGLPVCEDWS